MPDRSYECEIAGGHDWRLFSRHNIEESEFVPQGDTGYDRAYGNIIIRTVGIRELWYCTRCRHEETVEIVSDQGS